MVLPRASEAQLRSTAGRMPASLFGDEATVPPPAKQPLPAFDKPRPGNTQKEKPVRSGEFRSVGFPRPEDGATTPALQQHRIDSGAALEAQQRSQITAMRRAEKRLREMVKGSLKSTPISKRPSIPNPDNVDDRSRAADNLESRSASETRRSTPSRNTSPTRSTAVPGISPTEQGILEAALRQRTIVQDAKRDAEKTFERHERRLREELKTQWEDMQFRFLNN